MNDAPAFHAGAAHAVIDPEPGVDLVGYLRRWRPSVGNGQPLEVNVLVTERGERRSAFVAVDAPSLVGAYASRLRGVVADAVGCDRSAVLANASHTHCAPPLPGHPKTGGSTTYLREEEARWAERLLVAAERTAARAAAALRPAVVGFASLPFDGGVNRRQRTADGGTIMGWNPDGPVDRAVSVIRIDDLNEQPITTVVSYSCHPTVLGPDVLTSSSDFVGPMRERIRSTIGGECLFLQGTAGNIFPLEAVHTENGPEVEFGRRLAHVALHARDLAATIARIPTQTPYKSSVDVAIWRLVPADEQPVPDNAAIELPVSLPLMDVPSPVELAATRRQLEAELAALRAGADSRDVWNAVWLHSEWAARMEQRLTQEGVWSSVESTVSAYLLGTVLIVALPCEPFCEIGLAIKAAFDIPVVVVGYSNDMIGYVASEEEYPFGGYEPWTAPRHFDQPCPYSPEAAGILTERGIEAGRTLLASASIHGRTAA